MFGLRSFKLKWVLTDNLSYEFSDDFPAYPEAIGRFELIDINMREGATE